MSTKRSPHIPTGKGRLTQANSTGNLPHAGAPVSAQGAAGAVEIRGPNGAAPLCRITLTAAKLAMVQGPQYKSIQEGVSELINEALGARNEAARMELGNAMHNMQKTVQSAAAVVELFSHRLDTVFEESERPESEIVSGGIKGLEWATVRQLNASLDRLSKAVVWNLAGVQLPERRAEVEPKEAVRAGVLEALRWYERELAARKAA